MLDINRRASKRSAFYAELVRSSLKNLEGPVPEIHYPKNSKTETEEYFPVMYFQYLTMTTLRCASLQPY